MSAIKVTLPDSAMLVDGLRVTFRAPCACSSITGITIGEDTYTLVDAMNSGRAGEGNVWATNALVTVLLDVTNKRAYILNAAVNAYIKSHNHSASEINSGTLSIARGGTGAFSAAAARSNLGITPSNIGAAPAYEYSTTDLTAGSSSLTTGKLYFVYE